MAKDPDTVSKNFDFPAGLLHSALQEHLPGTHQSKRDLPLEAATDPAAAFAKEGASCEKHSDDSFGNNARTKPFGKV